MNWLLFAGAVVSAALFVTTHVMACLSLLWHPPQSSRLKRLTWALACLLLVLPTPFRSFTMGHKRISAFWSICLLTYVGTLAAQLFLKH